MADEDDLDAFFDDVEKVADEAVVADDDEGEAVDPKEGTPPPAKKQKTAPIRPVGVVVAAASSALKKNPTTTESDVSQKAEPAPSTFLGSTSADTAAIGPAFPPPQHQQYQHQHHNMGGPIPVGPEVGPAMPPTAFTTTTNHHDTSTTKPKQGHIRTAGGKTWVDTSLDDWPDDDFRIFVGNLGNDVTDIMLYQHFEKYASLQRAKIVRDAKKTQQQAQQQQQHNDHHHRQHHQQSDSKGYGFVSFANALDCAKALREMDQTWLGSRPIRIKRSTWKDREMKQVRKREKFHKKHQKKRGLL